MYSICQWYIYVYIYIISLSSLDVHFVEVLRFVRNRERMKEKRPGFLREEEDKVFISISNEGLNTCS